MKSIKKMLIIVICFLVMFSNMHIVKAETMSGTCGDNMTWHLDTSTGVLKINGRGNMNNYYNSG